MTTKEAERIHSPRIIFSILAELSFRGTEVSINERGKKKVSAGLINIQEGNSFKDSKITLEEVETEDSRVYCEAVAAGKKINFTLKKNSHNEFSLPEEIKIYDFRSHKRIVLKDCHYPVDVSYPGGVIHGYANDINMNFISIKAPQKKSNIEKGTSCKILVRQKHGQTDILYGNYLLREIKHFKNENLYIFVNNRKSAQEKTYRAKRNTIEGATIGFKSYTFGDTQFSGYIKIQNISWSGFYGEIILDNRIKKLPLGINLISEDTSFRFTLSRTCGTFGGFSVETLNSNSQTEWINFVKRYTQKGTGINIDIDALKEIFTSSGMMKNRRNRYNENAEDHMVHHGTQIDPLLAQRFINESESGEISEHVAVHRLSDNSWIIHEGMAADKRTMKMNDFYDETLFHLAEKYKYMKGLPRYVSAIFNPSFAGYWGEKASLPGNFLFSSHHENFKDTNKFMGADTEISVLKPESLNTLNKYEYSKAFNPVFLDLVDYWRPGKNNELLNERLINIGKGHSSSLRLLVDKQDMPLALVYKVNTYYSSNISGIINTLFILASNYFTGENYDTIIKALGNYPEFVLGTEDIQLISDNKNVQSAESSFRFCILDLNGEFVRNGLS